MSRFLCIASFFLLTTTFLNGQSIELQAGIHKASIWRSSPRLSEMYGFPTVLTVGFNYGGFSDRPWAALYPGVRAGAEMTFYDFDNKSLGKAAGVSTFIALRIPGTQKFYSKFNGGVSWVSKPYHPTENPGNFALGGPWAFVLQGVLYYEVPFGSQWVARPGIGLHHLSTCSYFQPNTGLNMPSIVLELGNRTPQKEAVVPQHLPIHQPGWDVLVQGGLGRKSVEVLDRQRFWVGSANAGILRRLSPVNSLGLELNFVSSQADNNYLKNRIDKGLMEPVSDYKRMGVALQHELIFGKVSFYYALGRYLYDPSRLKKDWYQRYGLRYAVFDRIVFSPTMVAHLGTADFLEISLGYRFRS